ncbi:MAG TPA: hypothetical protein VGY96_00085 [Streptosporangiaceae bacterium]|nr:hypothetical protein [Streptosporangiaceae bacterium]
MNPAGPVLIGAAGSTGAKNLSQDTSPVYVHQPSQPMPVCT